MKKILIAALMGLCTFISLQAQTPAEDEATIRNLIKQFSAALVAQNYDFIQQAYAPEARIFPGGKVNIIEGQAAIDNYWLGSYKRGNIITLHRIEPQEIVLNGNYAYDYGYYYVQGHNGDDQWPLSKGKYVIVWQRIAGQWKILLDAWSPAPLDEED